LSKKIAIIGSGIFGLLSAIKLSKISEKVDIFEKEKNSFQNATIFNHNRHHYGYHYPRSNETVEQCINSKIKFEKKYKDCLDFNFKNYYAISRNNSKVDAKVYENFLKKFNLNYKIQNSDLIFNKKMIEKIFLVNEGIYNAKKIQSKLIKKINKINKINIKYNTNIKKINFGDKFHLISNKKEFKKYDYVLNCTYSNINELLKKKREFYEYNLQQMAVIKIKKFPRFGATIMDGEFPSVLPVANTKNLYYFAHVKYSQIIKKISDSIPSEFFVKKNYISNYKKTLKESSNYLLILKYAEYIRSFYSIRLVKKNINDNRMTEINEPIKNYFNIISGKIITAEHITDKIYDIISYRTK